MSDNVTIRDLGSRPMERKGFGHCNYCGQPATIKMIWNLPEAPWRIRLIVRIISWRRYVACEAHWMGLKIGRAHV